MYQDTFYTYTSNLPTKAMDPIMAAKEGALIASRDGALLERERITKHYKVQG